MLTLTRKTDYALVALAELAAAAGGSLSSRELAERTNLPQPIMRNLLKDLAGAGILASEKGAMGGYRLARDAAEISAMAVIEAVDRPVQLARCCVSDAEHDHEAPEAPERAGAACTCPLEGSCRIRSAITRLQNRMLDLLRNTSLLDLLQDQAPPTVTIPTATSGSSPSPAPPSPSARLVTPISSSISHRRSIAGHSELPS